jgi:hypothetical protein
MTRKLLLVGLALSALVLMQATPASADAPGSLSQMSSTLTLIVLIGCVGICLGALLAQFRRPVLVAKR